jgi:long-chain acyl-CoA synthetase
MVLATPEILRHTNYVAVEAISRDAAHGAALLAKALEIALGEVDLSPSQYRLLVFLQESPSAATALAERLDVTRPSLTALVDGLVQRGLVVRATDPDDRRRVTHEISDAGRELVAAADAAITGRLGQIATHLDDPDREVANRGLEHWLTAIRAARTKRTAS